MNGIWPRVGAVVLAIALLSAIAILRDMITPTPQTGPLAVVEPSIGTEDSGTSGRMEITDDCVSIIHPDDTRSLLIWLRGSVAWDEADRSITVTNPDGSRYTMRDGDHITVGGAGGPFDTIDGVGSWVHRPAASCEAPEWFRVVEVSQGPPG